MAEGVTLRAAQEVVEAARKKAEEIDVPMNIAVVDSGNNLTAFVRMDGAWLGSIDIAQNKAYTARAFDMSTKDLAPLCQPNQPLFGINASNQGRLIVFFGRDHGDGWTVAKAGHQVVVRNVIEFLLRLAVDVVGAALQNVVVVFAA